MRKLFTWIHEHPVWTVCLTVVALLAGLHFWANERSERRWEEYSAAARARGEKLTLAEIEPPPVPDAQNFASLPMWKDIFDETKPRPLELPKPAGGGNQPSFWNPVKGEPIDLAAWQKFFLDAGYLFETSPEPARDVLRGLEHYAPLFAQWGEWRTRPLSRFPLDYRAGMTMALPHLGTFQDAAKLFSLRMCAHLALGDSAAAYADFLEGFQAYHILQSEPTLIAGLVQIAVLAQLWNGVGDGLKAHQWAEPELAKLAADLSTVDVWKDRHRSLSSEKTFGNSMYQNMASQSASALAAQLSAISGFWGGSSPGASFIALMPKRVFRDNQLRHNRYLDELIAQIDAEGFHPDRTTPSGPEDIQGVIAEHYYFLFRISGPVFTEVMRRYVQAQTKLDQTRLAIALERYRLARGTFPGTLAELVPEWIAALPLDAGSRQPMIYRRAEGGQTFTLYGLGLNGIDEGGKVSPRDSEHRQKDSIWLHAPAPAGP